MEHKEMLRNLEFGRDRKGLVVACTKETRPYFICHFCAIFCCFLVKCKLFSGRSLSDRISELPDEVLAGIVSDLPLKEAVATSVLSRRWRYVWRSTTNLDFDAGEALLRLNDLKPKLLDQESRRYVHWVNRMMEQHSGPKIKKFIVCHSLNYRFATSIDKWVQFAMEKSVEELELDFLDFKATTKGLYSLPSKILTKHVGFSPLKVVYLENVNVTEEVFEHLLSHCPVLERFSVNWDNNLVNVRVVGPSLRLKYLLLYGCTELKSVEIRDTNLVSFSHDCISEIDLILSNVPFLVEVSMYGECPNSTNRSFAKLSSCLSQLESLVFDIQRFTDYWFNEEDFVFPTMESLKNLELIVSSEYAFSLRLLSSFLKAFPSLHKLVLKQMFGGLQNRKIRKAAKCLHHNLRVLKVVGYRGRPNLDEHVIYLIENAFGLEKIVIDPVRCVFDPRTHCTGPYKGKRAIMEEAKARTHAMHRLKPKVPSTVEFVCL